MGEAGEIFDLLDPVCDAFDQVLMNGLGVDGLNNRRKPIKKHLDMRQIMEENIV